MRVKEWSDRSLILDLSPNGDFEQIVRESFAGMRYVEAFALLHSWIDFLMWDMETDEPIKFKKKFLRINFQDSLRKIRKRGLISQTEADQLTNFDDKRDIIVHRIAFNTFARIDADESFPALKITKKVAERSFNNGLKLAKLLDAKRRMLLAQPHNLRRKAT